MVGVRYLDFFMHPLGDGVRDDPGLLVHFGCVVVSLDVFIQRFVDGFRLGVSMCMWHLIHLYCCSATTSC